MGNCRHIFDIIFLPSGLLCMYGVCVCIIKFSHIKYCVANNTTHSFSEIKREIIKKKNVSLEWLHSTSADRARGVWCIRINDVTFSLKLSMYGNHIGIYEITFMYLWIVLKYIKGRFAVKRS